MISTSGVAVETSAAVTCATVAVGLRPRYTAAAPATCGDAIDVPLMVRVELVPLNQPPVIKDPGALISTQVPKFV